MIETLIDFDKSLFLFLNGAHSSIVDYIMAAVSNRFFWIPFYAFLFIKLIQKFGFKAIYPAILAGLTIVLCDQLSVHLFKNVFLRLRPCHDPELTGLVHIVNEHCGGQYGFVSSHAANTFGLAVFLGKLFKQFSSVWKYGLLIWAVFVSYSRIYLGVHFPLDIVGGALLGALVAEFTFLILVRIDERYSLKIVAT